MKNQNPVLFGNALALEADRLDHTASGTRDAPGPCAASRAMALAHVAMADVCAAFGAPYQPWLKQLPALGGGGAAASKTAAIAAAAHGVVAGIYRRKQADHKAAFDAFIAGLQEPGLREGCEFGAAVAAAVLAQRRTDPASAAQLLKFSYDMPPGHGAGVHDEDPFHRGQGFYGEAWADELATPFGLPSLTSVEVTPVSQVPASQQAADLLEARDFGGFLHSKRSAEQEQIGVFWSYDGSSGIGTPPRLYNQFMVAVVVHDQRDGDVDELARLLALANLAMADAGVVAWRGKYRDNVARPVRLLNQGKFDGNGDVIDGAQLWEPLGAQASMGAAAALHPTASALGLGFAAPTLSGRKDFTPNFPSYPSGHATFGTAAFSVLRKWRGKDAIDGGFEFMSDEFNGVTTDSNGVPRPKLARRYPTLTRAIEENSESRIWLGVHWRYDSTYGAKAGQEVAEVMLASQYRKR